MSTAIRAGRSTQRIRDAVREGEDGMANRRTITQYTGPLDVEQAAEGITKARANAQSLLADAELLLEHQRWARATALAILSIEEAGKVALIRELLLARDEAELREGWRAYRSHSKKNVLWILPDLAAKGARSFEDLSPVGDPTSDHPQVLDSLKQTAFYSDVYGNGRWSSWPDFASPIGWCPPCRRGAPKSRASCGC